MDEQLRRALADLRAHLEKMDNYVKEHGYDARYTDGFLSLMKQADLTIAMTSTLLRTVAEERKISADESVVQANQSYIDANRHSMEWREKDVADVIRHRKTIEELNVVHLRKTRRIYREGFRQIADAILYAGGAGGK